MPDGTDADDGQTNSTATRYPYTNDVLAGVLVLFAIGTTAAYLAQQRPVPIWLATVDALAIGTAVAWAFGARAFAAAKEAVAGGGGK